MTILRRNGKICTSLLLLLYFLDVSTLDDDKFLKIVTKQSFKGKHDVCFHGDCRSSVLKTLIYNRIPLKTLHLARKIRSDCNAYIICSTFKEFGDIIDFILPGKRILFLVFNTNFTSYTPKFVKTYEKGLDLVLVQPLASNIFKISYAFDNTAWIVTESNVTIRNQKWNPTMFLKRTGRKIVAGLFHCPPFVEVEGEKISGAEFSLLREFTRHWPIKYRVLKNTNESVNLYSKIHEELRLKKIDIGICNLWLKSVVEMGHDYSLSLFSVCFTFLVQKPRLLPSSLFLFHPFQASTWIFIILTAMLIGALSKVRVDGGVPLQCFQCSERIFLIAVMIFGFLTSTYHSAGMSVMLNFPRFSQDYVKDLNDMVKYNIKWEEPDKTLQLWLLNTNHSLGIAIAKNWIDHDLEKKQMNDNLRTGKYALHVSLTSTGTVDGADELDDHERMYLRLVPECLATFYSATAFPTNSPFTLIFRLKYNLYLENGIMNYWVAKTERKKKYRWMQSLKLLYASRIFGHIDLEKLEGIVYFLLLGHLSGLICFVLEILSLRYVTIKAVFQK